MELHYKKRRKEEKDLTKSYFEDISENNLFLETIAEEKCVQVM